MSACLTSTVDIKLNASIENRNGHLLTDALNDNEQKAQY